MTKKTSITIRIPNEILKLLKTNKSEHITEVLYEKFHNKIKCATCNRYCNKNRIHNSNCVLCNDEITPVTTPVINDVTKNNYKSYSKTSKDDIIFFFEQLQSYRQNKTKNDISVKEWVKKNIPISYVQFMHRIKELGLNKK